MLEVRGLSVSFKTRGGKVSAIKDVSFTLPRGRTLGIVGESGSGKSVTSLAIMRLIPSPPGEIEAGEIWFDSPSLGRSNLLTLSEKQMRHLRGNEIAMIFQEPMTSLNPVFTCGDQVVEAIRLHQKVSTKEAKQRALALFEEVKLPNPSRIFSAYPHQLSGGQKQRVMIAMAISCEPALLIADEPTTALDVTVQKTILDLLQELQVRHGMSLIFISHDLGVIGEICDEVLVMYKGKVVEQGEVRDIFSNPRDPYTRGLIACRPPLDRRLNRLPTLADFLKAPEKLTVEDALKAETITVEAYRARQQTLSKQSPILTVENLQVHFPVTKGIFGRVVDYVRAVDGVSFSVYPGETVGLVGESGSGKTTTGRAILRLIEPTGGRITFMGEDILRLSKERLRGLRKHMQIIFQDPYSSLNPRLTVGSTLTEPLLFHKLVQNPKEAKDRAISLLEQVGLEAEHFYRYPHEFSGGQRQRIAIARALAVQPKFIICDESVSALDVSVQAQVLNLLLDLQEKYGLSYIFISHDLSVVKFMSDRLLVMHQGQVVESGYSEDIYRSPQHPYTQKLIEAIPKGRIEDIEAAVERRRKGRGVPVL
ncbi:MAG: ABC transporter ATP-binding protein [Bacteroidia bacterium]|nr:ABC transporter ATP-binding protein [Bacteroidia bacterium]MCX7653020.1 ABC transporter ATP-binding protein [Bacteroidia bacterium]MDW8416158.1 ABC transporter ATP-binding protein [Bacteroidia bacterium]